jgi:hypothetical protein
MELLILLLIVCTTIWVGFDATGRNWSPTQTKPVTWVIGCVLLWIVVFPLYLFKRRHAPVKSP